MRTARSSIRGVSPPGTPPRSRHPPGSRHPPREQTPPGSKHLPQEQTHAYENITLPQTSFAGGKYVSAIEKVKFTRWALSLSFTAQQRGRSDFTVHNLFLSWFLRSVQTDRLRYGHRNIDGRRLRSVWMSLYLVCFSREKRMRTIAQNYLNLNST